MQIHDMDVAVVRSDEAETFWPGANVWDFTPDVVEDETEEILLLTEEV